MVQLHGDEPPDYCDQIPCRVIKRFGIEPDDTAESLTQKMQKYRVSGYMLDPGAGDGQPFDWAMAKNIPFPLIVAGGLNPDNVSQVVSTLKPYAVDVSSGVEKQPGKKDEKLIKRFILNIRTCN